MTPVSVSIRTYQVGFGDCFLMSIAYEDDSEKHVLIDFGTTKLPDDVPKSRMTTIARDIARRSNGKLDAIVATHRHQDHISGFATTKSAQGPGSIIAKLDPELVIQPWTEHPDVPMDATGPAPAGFTKHMAGFSRSLSAMQRVSANYVAETNRNTAYLMALDKDLRAELKFIGEDNIKNASAVRNLIAMGHAKGRGRFLNAGANSDLSTLIGADVLVLGPPTVRQHAQVRQQKSRDEGEYWHLAAAASETILSEQSKKARPLFPNHVIARTSEKFPIADRYLISRARKMRGRQMLQIVRMLDSALNNTSLILLFTIGTKSFLFPGDAQIENWQFALANEKWMKKLAGVDVYKVGHHGSLNATPLSLWRNFSKKSTALGDERRLHTLMSTLEGKHGHAKDGTEVPRETLVTALHKKSQLFSTQSMKSSELFHDMIVDVR